MWMEDREKFAAADAFAAKRKTRGEVIALLRDRSKWPVNFAWDYQQCGTCALGLAFAALGIVSISMISNGVERDGDGATQEFHRFRDALGLSLGDAAAVFYYAHEVVGVTERHLVTPDHVAGILETRAYR